jgi:hypothetical protein
LLECTKDLKRVIAGDLGCGISGDGGPMLKKYRRDCIYIAQGWYVQIFIILMLYTIIALLKMYPSFGQCLLQTCRFPKPKRKR